MLHPKTNKKPHSFCTGSFLQEIQIALSAPNIYSVLNIPLFALHCRDTWKYFNHGSLIRVNALEPRASGHVRELV